MERQVNGVNFTLFKTDHIEGNNKYSIQLNTDFSNQSLEPRGYKILIKPSGETETLSIQLFVAPGDSSHIEHDFEIGFFPNSINNWNLEVQYFDVQTSNELTDKKVSTVQAEGEAEPRPVIEGSLG